MNRNGRVYPYEQVIMLPRTMNKLMTIKELIGEIIDEDSKREIIYIPITNYGIPSLFTKFIYNKNDIKRLNKNNIFNTVILKNRSLIKFLDTKKSIVDFINSKIEKNPINYSSIIDKLNDNIITKHFIFNNEYNKDFDINILHIFISFIKVSDDNYNVNNIIIYGRKPIRFEDII